MKRGLMLIILFFGFISNAFSFCNADVITKDDVLSDEELEECLFYLVNEDYRYMMSQDRTYIITVSEEYFERLEKYGNTYDNYKYFIGILSLYLRNSYYNAGKITESNQINHDISPFPIFYSINNDDDDFLEKATTYDTIYQKNKNIVPHRIIEFFYNTDLSYDEQNNIEFQLNNIFSLFLKKKSNLLERNKKNYYSKLINTINEKIKIENNNKAKYSYYYFRLLLQNELFSLIENNYYNGNYNKVIEDFFDYKDYFSYNTENMYISQLFIRFRDLYYASSILYSEKLLEDKNTLAIDITKTAYDNIEQGTKYYLSHGYYSKRFSCILENAYKNNSELEKSELYKLKCNNIGYPNLYEGNSYYTDIYFPFDYKFFNILNN